MAGDEEQSLIQENIEEYVHDENKIVTCKWLSLMLNLKINVAKRALFTFVEHQRAKKGIGSVNVTYFVAGLGKSKSGDLEHKCIVVPESDVDTVKQSLTALTSCHIYSVQRAVLKDYTPLYQTDIDIIQQNLDKCSSQSSIKCGWAAQMEVRLPAKALEIPGNIIKSERNGSSSTISPAASTSTTKSTKKAEPRGSIASMFAAGGQKKGAGDMKASTKPNDQRTGSDKNKPKPAEKKKGVLAFLSTNGANKKTSPENEVKKTVIKTPEKKQQPATGKQFKDSDEEPDRKRRRIKHVFDSSDEEEVDDDDSRDSLDVKKEIPDEALESPLPLQVGIVDNEETDTPVISNKKEESPKLCINGQNGGSPRNNLNGGGRKRKRTMKTVLKQYQDEDGFLVTKKETVMESESDDSAAEETVVVEEEKSKPGNPPDKQSNKSAAGPKVEQKTKSAAKKLTSPQKGKQTLLMNFFKKR